MQMTTFISRTYSGNLILGHPCRVDGYCIYPLRLTARLKKELLLNISAAAGLSIIKTLLLILHAETHFML
jgi:hypothetical protein